MIVLVYNWLMTGIVVAVIIVVVLLFYIYFWFLTGDKRCHLNCGNCGRSSDSSSVEVISDEGGFERYDGDVGSNYSISDGDSGGN